MRMKIIICLAACLIMLFPSIAFPAEWHVPANFPTIQDAINNSIDGDSVIVSPDTYTGKGNYNIHTDGKAITIQSTNPENPDVVAATIIDCQGNGTGFIFDSGEDSSTVIMGLTIVNGYSDQGGGIYCSGSGPKIMNCTISNNYAYSGGAGIYCGDGASPIILYCVLYSNLCLSGNGGGICCENSSSPVIYGCPVLNNSAGLYPCPDSSLNGGGIFCADGSNPKIRNCRIKNNTATGKGGGLAVERSSPSTFDIKNCIIAGNSAAGSGNSIALENGELAIKNSTVSGNTNQSNSSIFVYMGTITVNSSILHGNSGFELYLYNSVADLAYNNLDDNDVKSVNSSIINWAGNLSGDPCLGEDCRLTKYSYLCIDNGDPDFIPEAAETDIDGEHRVINSRVDMGADEFTNSSPIADAGPDGVFHADFNGFAQVCLDGSGSSDPDGDELEYIWSINGITVAEGMDPCIVLPIGKDQIELTVSDGVNNSEDYTIASVDSALRGRLFVGVRAGYYMIVIILLPPPNSEEHVMEDKLTLYPECIEAKHQSVSQIEAGVKIVALFQLQEFIYPWIHFEDADLFVPPGEDTKVVQGILDTGEKFFVVFRRLP